MLSLHGHDAGSADRVVFLQGVTTGGKPECAVWGHIKDLWSFRDHTFQLIPRCGFRTVQAHMHATGYLHRTLHLINRAHDDSAVSPADSALCMRAQPLMTQRLWCMG